jgi:hypothetical protein
MQAGAEPSTGVVRVAMGWRARAVERGSTAGVTFPDDDLSSAILEDARVALAYADPGHGFTLPPGRFLRLDQAAGRVFGAEATPHLDPLPPPAAVALADSVARLLDGARWSRMADAGLGSARAAATATAAAAGDGFGVVEVGSWRVARSTEAWAAVPAAPRRDGRARWDGVEARVSLRPVRRSGADVRLTLQVRIVDERMEEALTAMMAARRARDAGAVQTLTGWDERPSEPPAAPAPARRGGG